MDRVVLKVKDILECLKDVDPEWEVELVSCDPMSPMGGLWAPLTTVQVVDDPPNYQGVWVGID